MHPIVIIGSGMAGYAAAREFRKLNTEQELIMICADDAANYAKPTLSNAFTGKKGRETVEMSAAYVASALGVPAGEIFLARVPLPPAQAVRRGRAGQRVEFGGRINQQFDFGAGRAPGGEQTERLAGAS